MSKWIEPAQKPDGNGMYIFRKTFDLKGDFSLRLSASTRYKLYINNQYVCEGPCQGTRFEHFYETTTFKSCDKTEIRVEVMHIVKPHFTPTFTSEKPMLWAEIFNGDNLVGGTDASWSLSLVDGIEFFEGDLVMFSAGPMEKHTMPYKEIPLPVAEGNEAYADSNSCDHVGLFNHFRLFPRLIPQMKTHAPEQPKLIKTLENALHFDAGRYTTAKVKVTVKGKKGDTLKLTYGECYLKSAVGWTFEKGQRDDTSGFLTGPSDYIKLNGETQQVEFMWYRAFRFIEVSADDIGNTDLKIEFMPYFYPFDIKGTFSCSDEAYNKMWDVSLNTLLCCTQEIVVDCPYFEQQQYNMDSFFEANYILQISDDTRIVKKMISDLSQSQQPNGLLLANYPSRFYQIIPTFSIYWIMLLHMYYTYSGDAEFVKPYMGTVDKILCYFDNHLEKGLVQSTYWPFLDWAGDWVNGTPHKGKEEPICVYSMQYSMGLKCASVLAEATQRHGLFEEYEARRKTLNQNIKTTFWNAEKSYYNDTLTNTESSQHTGLWAILTDIDQGDDAKALLNKMLSEDMAKCSFSMGYFLFRALEKTDMYQFAFSQFDGFKTMLDQGCTAWCENPDKPRSECHGWSATPLYEFHRNILGVKPKNNGYTEVEIKPNLGHLTFAEGKVPTPHGVIEVSVHKSENGYNITHSAPENIKISM